eukprot:GHVP01038697.1.p1 GENE.GHVP01038697.1~~GHVP01038697.1.p1  ORF type:complete len:310 (+),score=44.68 GHVP01038697.1:834-1763(+)
MEKPSDKKLNALKTLLSLSFPQDYPDIIQSAKSLCYKSSAFTEEDIFEAVVEAMESSGIGVNVADKSEGTPKRVLVSNITRIAPKTYIHCGPSLSFAFTLDLQKFECRLLPDFKLKNHQIFLKKLQLPLRGELQQEYNNYAFKTYGDGIQCCECLPSGGKEDNIFLYLIVQKGGAGCQWGSRLMSRWIILDEGSFVKIEGSVFLSLQSHEDSNFCVRNSQKFEHSIKSETQNYSKEIVEKISEFEYIAFVAVDDFLNELMSTGLRQSRRLHCTLGTDSWNSNEHLMKKELQIATLSKAYSTTLHRETHK